MEKEEIMSLLVLMLFLLILAYNSKEEIPTGLSVYSRNVYSCYELSKQKNEFEPNYIFIKEKDRNSIRTRFDDECKVEGQEFRSWLTCAGDNCGVYENYCESYEKFTREFIKCQYGCKNGACLSSPDGAIVSQAKPSSGSGLGSWRRCTTGCG